MENSLRTLRNLILRGDSVENLRTIPAESVDMVFADPPYNLQLGGSLFRPDQSRVDGVEESWDRFDNFEAYDLFTLEWLTEVKRVLKKIGRAHV